METSRERPQILKVSIFGRPELIYSVNQIKIYLKSEKDDFTFQVEDEDGDVDWRVETIKDVEDEDPTQIFLVDHAWTFRTDQVWIRYR